ncbi:hypothetical protein AB0I39_16910 [Kitasatospora purpeofusca]|uniref:hypothetical protein n=1 Tax=Kitasatospora purpeofusca TaxID=67352 RepID=UPI0033E51BAA
MNENTAEYLAWLSARDLMHRYFKSAADDVSAMPNLVQTLDAFASGDVALILYQGRLIIAAMPTSQAEADAFLESLRGDGTPEVESGT